MIWIVVVVVFDWEAEGVAGLVETSCVVVETGFGFGVACAGFAFFAGAPIETGSVACCTFLFAIFRVIADVRRSANAGSTVCGSTKSAIKDNPNFWLIAGRGCYLILSVLGIYST